MFKLTFVLISFVIRIQDELQDGVMRDAKFLKCHLNLYDALASGPKFYTCKIRKICCVNVELIKVDILACWFYMSPFSLCTICNFHTNRNKLYIG